MTLIREILITIVQFWVLMAAGALILGLALAPFLLLGWLLS